MPSASSVGDLHRMTGWYAVWLLGLVGVWGLALAVWRREPGRPFRVGFGVATAGVLGQVGLGLWARSVQGVEPGSQHVFYGIVIVFTLVFAYIYRSQMARRPALAYGALALFLMGLGMRAIATFGRGF
jgi:hypothetical protein